MRILLALKQRNYLNAFAGVVNELLRRGHAVRLAWPDEDVSRPEEVTAAGDLSIEACRPKRSDEWAPVAATVRRAFDKRLHSRSHGDRRPVFTILAGEAADGQASTLHFRYLLASEGGCVTLASALDEHRTQLTAALDDPGQPARLRAFATSFLRPAGRSLPASRTLADTIESVYGTHTA